MNNNASYLPRRSLSGYISQTLWVVDQWPSAFSALVQLEEGVGEEELGFDFERVGVEWLAARWVQNEQWSWSS